MFEAMQLVQEGSRTYSFKIRKGFYQSLSSAKEAAKKKAEQAKQRGENAVPYVQLNGICVWSPLADRLGL